MRKLLHKYRLLLIILAVINVSFITLSLIKLDYSLTVPAKADSIEELFEIENESALKGEINVVSVYSYDKINLLSFLLGKVNPYADIDKTFDYYDYDLDEMIKGGQIQKNVSIYNSLIAGYMQAGYNLDYSFLGFIIHTKTNYAPSNLKIGDIITHVEELELSNEFSLSDAIKENESLLKEKGFLQMQITRKIDNKDESLTLDVYPKITKEDGKIFYSFGISAYPYNIPRNTNNVPNFKIRWENITSIGPSGGLLQAFYVYEKLTGANLSKNLKIAGTGTVDIFGSAGPIGGIAQKIIACELSGIDVFFVPVKTKNYENDETETNYQEAKAAYEKIKNPHMALVAVSSVSDIIEYLESYSGK